MNRPMEQRACWIDGNGYYSQPEYASRYELIETLLASWGTRPLDLPFIKQALEAYVVELKRARHTGGPHCPHCGIVPEHAESCPVVSVTRV